MTAKSIAIIGAGPSGIVAAETLRKNKFNYDKVRVFEKRDSVGGVWNYSHNLNQPTFIPFGHNLSQVDPLLHPPINTPLSNLNRPSRTSRTRVEQWIGSPAYDDLRTNVTKSIMCFSDSPTTADSDERFVLHTKVKEYLEKYAQPAIGEGWYMFNTSVEEVEPIPRSSNPKYTSSKHQKQSQHVQYKYRLTLRRENPDKTDSWWTEEFDAIIIASGQFNVPYIPNIPGLYDFWSKYPNNCLHSKYFKNSRLYKDKIVIVVGCGVSGNDIALRASRVASKLYQSKRNPSRWEKIPGFVPPPNVIDKPEIAKIEKRKRVIFVDGSIVENVDHLVLATGYQHDYKFLRKHFGNNNYPEEFRENNWTGSLLKDGKLSNLFLQTFSKDYPNLTFIGSERMGSWAAFREYEYQACAIDGVFSERSQLPSLREMNRIDLEIADVLKDIDTKPFQPMLVIRRQAIEFAKLAGGFRNDSITPSIKRNRANQISQVNRVPKWTHGLDKELLESSLEYLIECAYQGRHPTAEQMKQIYTMLKVPELSPSDDDVYSQVN